MGWDPAPHFKDHHGNDYVGLDLEDAENLAAVLDRLLDLISCPAVRMELIENLQPAEVNRLIEGLGAGLTYVQHLLRPPSTPKPAEGSSPSPAAW